MEEMIELVLKRISELEKKVEKYFSYLEVSNELDFILKGGYILKSDLDELILEEQNEVVEENGGENE